MFRQVMVDNIAHPKVQEFFERQTPEARALLGFLRQEALKCCPGLREEYKWGAPYYRAKKSLAYLNVRKGVVEVGFTQGHRLADPEHWLQGTELQLVRHLRYNPNTDIDPAPLRALLAQAAELAQG